MQNFENKKLEFTVYLNTDYVYSLLLNYLAINWEAHTTNPNFKLLNEDDIIAITKSWPANL